jgi:hypothetical protein
MVTPGKAPLSYVTTPSPVRETPPVTTVSSTDAFCGISTTAA